MPSERDQLRHYADCLSDEECSRVNKVIEIICPPTDPVYLECHFCRVTCSRENAPDIGWIPSFYMPFVGQPGALIEVDAACCNHCKNERLRYNDDTCGYELRKES